MAEPGLPDGAGSSVTTLPAAPRRRWPAPLLIAVAALVVAAVVVVVVLTTGGRSKIGGPAGPTRSAPSSPAVADTGHVLQTEAAAAAEAHALITRGLPAAAQRFPVTAPTPSADVTLAPDLSLTDQSLPACLAALEDGESLLGVDRVVYQGSAALLVVTTSSTPTQADAFIVGPGCASPGASGLRAVLTVSR